MAVMRVRIEKTDKQLNGAIRLDGSKSISNRVLIIRALCKDDFTIEQLSHSDDTKTLEQLLSSENETLHAGAAGTTFRFLTAYLAVTTRRKRLLTGSERMLQRPVGPLVQALRQLGCNIKYLGAEGYPPLQIDAPHLSQSPATLKIDAGISSQFISALLLVGPVIPGGLQLELTGALVSRPYLEMTLKIMRHFGVNAHFEDAVISVEEMPYQPKPFTVEADWSAASYYYSMMALSEGGSLTLRGLFRESLQGDSAVAEMMTRLGVSTEFSEGEVLLTKSAAPGSFFEQDFLPCPDLAQTLAVACAGLGVHGLFTGLETLRIKETDRITALKNELARVGVRVVNIPSRFSKRAPREFFSIEGKAQLNGVPCFQTYEDHRMAMAFAPLALLGPIEIAEPGVVSKSYPDFWKDLQSLGFGLEYH